MTAVAVFKWAANPGDAIVRDDGSINWKMARFSVGDDDHAAVKVACDVSEGAEVVGLTMVDRDVSFAAARGAARTVAIDGLCPMTDPLIIAQSIAQALKTLEGVDVVAIGDCEWEPTVPALVAAILGWPALMAVDAAEPDGDGLKVTRRFGTGTQDVSAPKPIVLGVAARREEESKPGMKDILAARKKPIDKVGVASLLMIDEVRVLAEESTALPDAANSMLFDGSDPETAVGQLIQALQSDGSL